MDIHAGSKHGYIQMGDLKEQQEPSPAYMSNLQYRSDIESASQSPSPMPSPLPYMAPRNNIQNPNAAVQPSLIQAWMLEIVAWLVALTSLVGIWLLLRHFDNQPMPSFPYNITLNTIVSVMTQVVTICSGHVISEVIGQTKWIWYGSSRQRPLEDFKVFDDAVRGPLGAATLLLTPRILTRSVATASCILVITTLAIGPFMQQLITYMPRTVPLTSLGGLGADSANATLPTIPRSTYYNAYLPGTIMALKSPDLAYKAAFYNGLYNAADPSMYAISPECSTGNCTWPNFSSLGVCSTCVDSTADIISNCSSNATSCNYTMPGTISPVIATSAGMATVINITTYYNTTGAAENVPTYNSTLARLSIMLATGSVDYNISSYTCSLYVCSRAYEASMENGNLTEQVLATYPNDSTTAEEAESTVVFEESDVYSDTYAGPSNVTINPGTDSDVWDATAPSMGMLTLTLYALSSYMQTLFVGSGTGSVGENSFKMDTQQVLYLAHQEAEQTQQVLPAEEGYAVGYVMKSIATSLTNTIRSDAQSKGTAGLEGEAWTVTTYVLVDWDWIALPAIVLALSFVQLAVVMYKSWSSQIPYFKSSTLPALFLQIPGAPSAVPEVPHAPDTTAADAVKSGMAKQQLLALQRAMDTHMKTT